MIAGVVIAQHATLATRNTAHFEDISVSLIDPWRS
jgi:predicted nucleic acid-binding protein